MRTASPTRGSGPSAVNSRTTESFARVENFAHLVVSIGGLQAPQAGFVPSAVQVGLRRGLQRDSPGCDRGNPEVEGILFMVDYEGSLLNFRRSSTSLRRGRRPEARERPPQRWSGFTSAGQRSVSLRGNDGMITHRHVPRESSRHTANPVGFTGAFSTTERRLHDKNDRRTSVDWVAVPGGSENHIWDARYPALPRDGRHLSGTRYPVHNRPARAGSGLHGVRVLKGGRQWHRYCARRARPGPTQRHRGCGHGLFGLNADASCVGAGVHPRDRKGHWGAARSQRPVGRDAPDHQVGRTNDIRRRSPRYGP